MSTFKCLRDPQHPPPNPTNSCSVHPKSHRELHHLILSHFQHPLPNPMGIHGVQLQIPIRAAMSTSKSRGQHGIHLQTPLRAAVSISKPNRELQHPLPSLIRSCSAHLQPRREPQHPPPNPSADLLPCPSMPSTHAQLLQQSHGLSSDSKSLPGADAMLLSLGRLRGSWVQCGCEHLLL